MLEMGGKIAEEAQRRHLAVSAARASVRAEAKRIDELQAAAAVSESEKATAIKTEKEVVGGEASSLSQELTASLESRIDSLIGADGCNRQNETLSSTMMQMLSSFEKKWRVDGEEVLSP